MDQELIRYYEKCVRTAETRAKIAKETVLWWQGRVQIFDADLENARARLRKAQEAGEEAAQ